MVEELAVGRIRAFIKDHDDPKKAIEQQFGIISHRSTFKERNEFYNYFTLENLAPDFSTKICFSIQRVHFYVNKLPPPAVCRALQDLLYIGIIFGDAECPELIVANRVELFNVRTATVECKILHLENSNATANGDLEKLFLYGKSNLHCAGVINMTKTVYPEVVITGNPLLKTGSGDECKYFQRIERIECNQHGQIPDLAKGTFVRYGQEQTFSPNVSYYRLIIDWQKLTGSYSEKKFQMKEILNQLIYARELIIILPLRQDAEYRAWLPDWLIEGQDQATHNRVPYYRLFIDWTKLGHETAEIPELSELLTLTRQVKCLKPALGWLNLDFATVEEISETLTPVLAILPPLIQIVSQYMEEKLFS